MITSNVVFVRISEMACSSISVRLMSESAIADTNQSRHEDNECRTIEICPRMIINTSPRPAETAEEYGEIHRPRADVRNINNVAIGGLRASENEPRDLEAFSKFTNLRN
jgi:hypothetical protein